MLILGFSGRARHGKTLACEAIKRYCAGRIHETAKIYEFSAFILDWCIKEGRLPAGTVRAEMTKEQLTIMVKAGNDGRAINRDFWVGQFLAAMFRDNPDVALTPNIRFPHEVDVVRQLGGFIVRCTRLNADGSVYISPDRDPNDVTETSLDLCPADFYLTAKNGNAFLMDMQAVTLYRYLIAGEQ